MKRQEFLNQCSACGGNWTAMIMSGIKEVAPEIYETMPDRAYDFDEVVFISNHLCYDAPHFRFNMSLGGHIIEYSPEGKFLFREATEEEREMSAAEFHKKYNDPFYEEDNHSDGSSVTPMELSSDAIK